MFPTVRRYSTFTLDAVHHSQQISRAIGFVWKIGYCTPNFAWSIGQSYFHSFSFIFPIEVAISRSHFQTETSGTQGSRTPKILIDRWQLWLVVCQGAKRCTPDTPVQLRAVTGMGTSCYHHDRGCWPYDILLLYIYNCVYPLIIIYSLIFFNNKLGTQSGDWDHARGEKPRTKEDLWT